MSDPKKVYLGDSVYAMLTGHSVVLTTENGSVISNTIVLEIGILDTLIALVNEQGVG